MSQILQEIAQAIYDGDDILAVELAEKAVQEGIEPQAIINGGIAGMEQLGEAFNNMEAFLPELMLGGEAMHALLDTVNPYMQKGGALKNDTIVIGCAQGDLHDIGLNLLDTQLSIGGFQVVNLGTDTSVSEFISEAKRVNAKIIGVSTLLTTSSYYQEELIKALKKEGIRDQYKVIVGGGPITPEWARKIGADGYARTASQAAELCKQLLQNKNNDVVVIC
ncbi:MAG: corrinoid protein [Bacillota bacterium]